MGSLTKSGTGSALIKSHVLQATKSSDKFPEVSRKLIEEATEKILNNIETPDCIFGDKDVFQGIQDMLDREEKLAKIKDTPLWKIINE